ncbi:MAG: hypothetical protein DWQ44_03405 [Bacteroidetes bacterium]|nr:MAG: hypothetical protein DWQ33_04400 [Bacteroidota bacterium]REJ99958.1 MAG: hypothetical protein DWQ39_13670 [Bacteroidota bacterium]REK35862.1 MAG: hypothetical protein DWQ44_03405 [Bacteroidota bacterium]REK50661.1 MAG: hypothetical protein DWQ48_04960 [Bacteroidota bacterium]
MKRKSKIESKGFSLENSESAKMENPFSVPSGYFQELGNQVKSNIQNLPTLDSANVKNPFAVPEGYFASLTEAIRDRIKSASTPSGFKTLASEIFRRPQIRLSLATLAILVVLLIKFTQKQELSIPENITCEELGNSIYIHELDEYFLVDELGNLPAGSTNGNTEQDVYIQWFMDNNYDINYKDIENHL